MADKKEGSPFSNLWDLSSILSWHKKAKSQRYSSDECFSGIKKKLNKTGFKQNGLFKQIKTSCFNLIGFK